MINEQDREEYLRETERIILYDIPSEQRGTFYMYASSIDIMESVVPENTDPYEGDVMIPAAKRKYYLQWLDTWNGRIAFNRHEYNGRYWSIHELNYMLIQNGKLNRSGRYKDLIALRALIIEKMIVPYKYHKFELPELANPMSVNECVQIATNAIVDSRIYEAKGWFDSCKRLTKLAINEFYNYDLIDV